MTMVRSDAYLAGLTHELAKLPNETEWVEFKHNNDDPEMIGEYVSAIANAAALAGKREGYMVWGLDDATHAPVGTTFVPSRAKVGNEQLETWLLKLIAPKVDFRFYEITLEGLPLVVLEIGAAYRHPVQFKGQEYIRIGSSKRKLKDHPERERELWRELDRTHFEERIACEHLGNDEVLQLLDYPSYFELLARPLPASPAGILEALEADALIRRDAAGRWTITNLGGVLFARKLADFPGLRRKAVRVILYDGTNRLHTVREQEGTKGYANGFEGLITFINGVLPANEVIGQALRRTVPVYPELAIRELIGNALIHQDFDMSGSGPMVEIFVDRIEITNPGVPLVDTRRFLDYPPRSRNEALAAFMRRVGICEERGSGVDKVVDQAERFQLPAPAFEIVGEHTRAVVFAPKPFARMDREERIRATYLHACLRYVEHDVMTNTTLRQRFGIEAQNSAAVSRVIREAIEAGMVAPYDESAGKRFMKYVPFWAKPVT
jgi:predicted HTH transcriptional regulator